MYKYLPQSYKLILIVDIKRFCSHKVIADQSASSHSTKKRKIENDGRAKILDIYADDYAAVGFSIPYSAQ